MRVYVPFILLTLYSELQGAKSGLVAQGRQAQYAAKAAEENTMESNQEELPRTYSDAFGRSGPLGESIYHRLGREDRIKVLKNCTEDYFQRRNASHFASMLEWWMREKRQHLVSGQSDKLEMTRLITRSLPELIDLYIRVYDEWPIQSDGTHIGSRVHVLMEIGKLWNPIFTTFASIEVFQFLVAVHDSVKVELHPTSEITNRMAMKLGGRVSHEREKECVEQIIRKNDPQPSTEQCRIWMDHAHVIADSHDDEIMRLLGHKIVRQASGNELYAHFCTGRK